MTGRIGVEVGGTFTDLVWQRPDGSLRTTKVLSTPGVVHKAVMQAVAESDADLAAVDHLVHGSTIATNALLTRAGPATGLITTRGFRDVIEIGAHDRKGSVYEIFYRKTAPPVPRRLVGEVDERIDHRGGVVTPLDEDEAWRTVEGLLEKGVASIAISLLHAYANPAHEAALARLIARRAPHVSVSCSHEISPEFREYERTMTTVVNAFVSPVVSDYIGHLGDELRAGGYRGVLQIMQSGGGIVPGEAAGRNAARMLLSGPAAGVRGAIWFARRNGLSDILTLDMGGTSTDVVLAPGLAPAMVPQLEVDGLPVRTPAVDMVTVGAGGGSIAMRDDGGLLAVGPASAGADPGPACYDRGGTAASVTDAQLAAGILRPARFFGGRMPLSAERAAAALSAIGIGGEPREVADAVLRVVSNNMAQALRRLVSTQRGIDPTPFTLVAYGGGGPLHAAMVAEEVGIRTVLVPWAPGLTSAFGLLVADVTVDLVRTVLQDLTDETLDATRVASLAEEWRAAAAAHGLDDGRYRVEIGVDLRYRGQAFELTVWGDDRPRDAAALREAFEGLHRQRYGYSRARLPVEAVNYRVRLVEEVGDVAMAPAYEGVAAPAERGEIFIAGAPREAVFLSRAGLGTGAAIEGPAVIEEDTATTLVPPGWRAQVTPAGDLLLQRGDA